uniref:Guanylate cyclase domain-containing protein n=1 Tax=Peronospora matthiolae TaxID=2874970 RepID=A0AAV1TCH4_9STRA
MQICVLFTEYEEVTDIRSAVVFADVNGFSALQHWMDESILDEKTQIERYTPQS